MGYRWFRKKCILDIDSASDYLIPEKRYFQVRKDEKDLKRYILEKSLLVEKDILQNHVLEEYTDLLTSDFSK